MKRVRQPEYGSLLLAVGFIVALGGFLFHLYRTTAVSLDRWIFYRWYEQPENRWWPLSAGMGVLLVVLLGRAFLLREARWRWSSVLLGVTSTTAVIILLLFISPTVSGMAQLTSVNLDNHVYGVFYQPPLTGSAFCSYVMVECEADGSQCRPLYNSMSIPKNIGFAVPLVLCDITFSSADDPARFGLLTDDHRVTLQINSTPVFTYPPLP